MFEVFTKSLLFTQASMKFCKVRQKCCYKTFLIPRRPVSCLTPFLGSRQDKEKVKLCKGC